MATFDTKPPLQLLKVAEKRVHCPGLVTFVFRSGTDEPLAPARAGQYIALTGEFDGSRVTRAYTLASSPRETEKEGVYIVTVKKAGVLSGWLTDRTDVGGEVLAGVPLGDFVYDEERDESHIVGVAGGAGITALLSLAKASSDGAPYTMTLFYAVDDSREFLFDEELAALDPSRVKVVRIAADGVRKDAEKGFFRAELIDKHVDRAFTLFMCGGDAFYESVEREASLSPFLRGVRRSPNGVTDRAAEPSAVYTLTVIEDGGGSESVPARDNETVMAALERAGLKVRSACHTGRCGWCRSLVLAGEYTVEERHDTRSEEDRREGRICLCCTYPDGDMTVVVPRALPPAHAK